MEAKDIKNEKKDVIDEILPEVSIECLRKIKSSFLVLKDSFITIANKDLIVLKYFISKNSNVNITKFLPLVGSDLSNVSQGKSSIFFASMRKATSQITNKLNYKKGVINVESIAVPIKYKEEIVGYISITTMNTELLKIINIFIESLAINIERELEKIFIEEEIREFTNLINIKLDKKPINCLSDKELLVTRYMLMAYSNAEIANELFISESTVKTYLKRIYDKFGTSNRVDTTIAIMCSRILGKL
ncbi:response regulator transcription factor [Clostridium saccharoperbutylacetonicum]|uniref:response regulator transcription factor n=1 Tax=Clostridium saccharoperbutylacetonicum TaxID=36745 RepID=UPI0039EC7F4D